MNRQELVRQLAKRLKVSQRLAQFLLEAFLEELTEALRREERVELRGFGSFVVRKRTSRRGPETKIRVVFKASKNWPISF